MDLCKHSHIYNYNKYSQRKRGYQLEKWQAWEGFYRGIYIYGTRKRDREEREVGSNIIQISLKTFKFKK